MPSPGGGHVPILSPKADAMPATSLGFGLAFFVAAFVSALLGLALRSYLADRLLLDHARTVIFRGDGGEGERRPNKPAQILTVANGACADVRWPATTEDPSQAPEASIDIERLAAIWRAETDDVYGAAAVTGTLALALHAMGETDDPVRAQQLADDMWRGRSGALHAAAG